MGTAKMAVRAYLTQLFLVLVAGLHVCASVGWGLLSMHGARAWSALLPAAWNEGMQAGYLPGGPFGMLGAVVYQFYRLVPPLWVLRAGEIDVTDHVLVSVPFVLVRASSNQARDFTASLLNHLGRPGGTRLLGVQSLVWATGLSKHMGNARPFVRCGADRLPPDFRHSHTACAPATCYLPPPPSASPRGPTAGAIFVATIPTMFATAVTKGLRPHLFASSDKGVDDGYIPAHVHYMMIFCPKWTQHLSDEDPARLADQLLFYTTKENAVSQPAILRQVALANAFTEFATGVHEQHARQGVQGLRRLAVAAGARTLVFVEALPGLWVHAVCTAYSPVYNTRAMGIRWRSTPGSLAGRRMGAAAVARCVGSVAGTCLSNPAPVWDARGRAGKGRACFSRAVSRAPLWQVGVAMGRGTPAGVAYVRTGVGTRAPRYCRTDRAMDTWIRSDAGRGSAIAFGVVHKQDCCYGRGASGLLCASGPFPSLANIAKGRAVCD